MEHMTAQEALDAAKGITFEKAWAIMEKRYEEDRKRCEEEQLKWEKKMVAEEKKRIAAEKKRIAEQKVAEKKRIEEQKVADEKRKAEMDRSNEEFKKNIERALGRLGNSLGDLTEVLFSGSLLDSFKEYGYDFYTQSQDKVFKEDGRDVCEIDIWLEDGDYIMAAEIKTRPTNADIDEYMEKLTLVRSLLDKRNDKRILIGAIAGGVLKPEVRRHTHKRGFFVIEQSGESVRIAKPPKGFKPREW